MRSLFGIIICTYNRCKSLKDTLESLLGQECDWSSIAEIIIVDNNSSDDTPQLIGSYSNSFKTKLKFLKETKQGKSHALNLAISVTQSDILIFTDDDVILDPHWLDEIIRFFNKNEVDVLGGRVLPLYSSQIPQWVKDNQYHLRGPIVSYDQGEDIIDFNSGKITAFIGANVAYKKNVFDTIGLYNINLGVGLGTLCEDIEMFTRAVKTGKKIFYNGRALVMHPIDPKRMTLGYFAKWNFQQGKSEALLDPIESKQKLSSIGEIPSYLFRSVLIKMIKLFLSIFQPRSFLKRWCALYFNLGLIAGYADYRRFNSPEKI